LLGRKVHAFDTHLQAQISDADVQAQLRNQLPSNIFVQILAGPRGVRTGAIGVMLRLIAQISLVIGPVALLVFFQIQFLPYHPPSGVNCGSARRLSSTLLCCGYCGRRSRVV
jgi:hypothetical protein